MDRNGIIAAGNWIIDHIKVIDTWPEQDALANISEEFNRNGGSPYNLLKDLHQLRAAFPLIGAGALGEDSNANLIALDCTNNAISTEYLQQLPGKSTSYTDVMTVATTGRRTFFHQRGANAHFTGQNIPFEQTKAKIFHLGYLLLLDQLDVVDAQGSTGAARLLEKAQNAGLITSADVVSESTDRFQRVVTPALPYIDYLFVNEYEASRIVNKPIDLKASNWQDQIQEIAQALIDAGANHWVILHFEGGCFALSTEGASYWQAAIDLPQEHIKGASGAGDAFAAGVLYGVHEGWDMEKCLNLAVSSAAACLRDASCSDSVLPTDEALSLGEKFGYKKLSHTIS